MTANYIDPAALMRVKSLELRGEGNAAACYRIPVSEFEEIGVALNCEKVFQHFGEGAK